MEICNIAQRVTLLLLLFVRDNEQKIRTNVRCPIAFLTELKTPKRQILMGTDVQGKSNQNGYPYVQLGVQHHRKYMEFKDLKVKKAQHNDWAILLLVDMFALGYGAVRIPRIRSIHDRQNCNNFHRVQG